MPKARSTPAPAAPGRYGAATIALHWLTLALLIAAYAVINLREHYPKGSLPREDLKTWHYMLGLAVLGLLGLRLLARLHGTAPATRPPLPVWQARLAAAVQGLLYLWLLAMPLLGWLLLSASGKPIPFFGFEWPALVAADKGLAEQVEEVHETLGTVGYFLIAAHSLAALVHHFITRDNTLRRMLPGA